MRSRRRFIWPAGCLALVTACLVVGHGCGGGDGVSHKQGTGGSAGSAGVAGVAAPSSMLDASVSMNRAGSGGAAGAMGMADSGVSSSDASKGGSGGGGGAAGGAGGVVGAQLTVKSVEPVARSLNAPVDGGIVIHFDRPVAKDSFTPRTFWAFGRWSGPMDGDFSFSDGDRTVTLKSKRVFSAGDRVTVILANTLKAADGATLRKQGYSFQFWTAAKAAPLTFNELARVSVKSPGGDGTRAYGGTASDLNRDGFLDLMIVNEDTSDLRIFINRGDGTGMFKPLSQPTTPLDKRSSPSEASDFNRDGLVDLVTANLNANNLTVLMGKGDGTFDVPNIQKLRVGAQPRGVAVLDVDGDGDVDIVNTNADGNNLTLLLNDGTGKFGTPKVWDAGLNSGTVVDIEWALFTGDMNEDGILDLVIGAKKEGGVVVNTGNGDGTFSFASAQGPNTSPWQLVVGDIDGDGHEDVATADAEFDDAKSKDTSTVLLGDGKGKLTMHQTFKTMHMPFAVDVGDLDGDGDLDIVISNYNNEVGSYWQIFENKAATFTQTARVKAAKSASCAIIADLNNDRTLDLVMIDESQDEIVLLTH